MTPEEEEARWPEHAKLKRASSRAERQAIGDFVTWLYSEKGYHLATYDDGGWAESVPTSTDDLIAQFYGVDLTAFNAEKADMLTYIREFYAKENESS